MKAITIDNFIKYIGEKVEVEIFCYEGGILYPDDNILVGMNPDYFYFYSKEDEIYWHWAARDNDITESKLNVSIEVYPK